MHQTDKTKRFIGDVKVANQHREQRTSQATFSRVLERDGHPNLELKIIVNPCSRVNSPLERPDQAYFRSFNEELSENSKEKKGPSGNLASLLT